MHQSTTFNSKQDRGDLTPASEESKQLIHPPRPWEIAVWLVGLVLFIALAVFVHEHPAPLPLELEVTKMLQGSHPNPCVYAQLPHMPINNLIDFVSSLNNPIPSIVSLAIAAIILLIFRLWRQAIFLVAIVGAGTGLFTLLGDIVGRPRPDVKYGICVHDLIPFHSFPSGHVIHDVVFAGFLFYISTIPPVSTWRYRWLLFPLQGLAIVDILLIGLSRLYAGEHWLLDVTGAYLTGLLCLFLFIFVYRWTSKRLVKKS